MQRELRLPVYSEEEEREEFQELTFHSSATRGLFVGERSSLEVIGDVSYSS